MNAAPKPTFKQVMPAVHAYARARVAADNVRAAPLIRNTCTGSPNLR